MVCALAAGMAMHGCGWTFGWDDYGGLTGGESDETGGYERTYFIAECTVYDVCQNTPLNGIGFDLQSALDNAGWTGQFKLNSGVRLTQFIDSIFRPGIGQDATGADSSTFAIFAGHANVGWIQVSKTDPVTLGCAMPLDNNLSLGSGSGDKAAVLAMVSSCSGYARRDGNNVPTADCFKASFSDSHLRQLLAFHNSPSVPNGQMEAFFNTLKVETVADLGFGYEPDYNNLSAWMDVMTVYYYPGQGENSPIVYTTRYHGGEDNLEDIHYDANLYTGEWIADNPEPKDYNDIAITAHTSLGADVQACAPQPANKGCY
jgi:hypothetical protein